VPYSFHVGYRPAFRPGEKSTRLLSYGTFGESCDFGKKVEPRDRSKFHRSRLSTTNLASNLPRNFIREDYPGGSFRRAARAYLFRNKSLIRLSGRLSRHRGSKDPASGGPASRDWRGKIHSNFVAAEKRDNFETWDTILPSRPFVSPAILQQCYSDVGLLQ